MASVSFVPASSSLPHAPNWFYVCCVICSEIVEKLKLELVLKCLGTDSLSKRVRALNDLHFLIKAAQRKVSAETTPNPGFYLTASVSWVEPTCVSCICSCSFLTFYGLFLSLSLFSCFLPFIFGFPC